MADMHVIGALREKRSELAGIVMSLERQLADALPRLKCSRECADCLN